MLYTDLNPSGGMGSNCSLLEIGPFKLVIDCGINPKEVGLKAVPALDRLQDHYIDLAILTHCHLDHLGALPLLVRQIPDTQVLMSIPSEMIYQRMLHNSVNVMRRQREEERAAALKSMLPGQEDPDAASARRLREMMEENKARFGRGYGSSSSYDKKGDEPPVRGSGMVALASAHFEKPARGRRGGTRLAAAAGSTMRLPPRLARRPPSIPPAATRARTRSARSSTAATTTPRTAPT